MRSGRLSSALPIIPKPVHLVHPLHAGLSRCRRPGLQPPPVHEILSVPEAEALRPEIGRDRTRCNAIAIDPDQNREDFGDVASGLFGAVAVTRVAEDLVKPQQSGSLDGDGHGVHPGA